VLPALKVTARRNDATGKSLPCVGATTAGITNSPACCLEFVQGERGAMPGFQTRTFHRCFNGERVESRLKFNTQVGKPQANPL